MKVNENGVAESNPYPDRPGERDCQFYLRTGLCGYGSSCRYNHPTHLPQVRNRTYLFGWVLSCNLPHGLLLFNILIGCCLLQGGAPGENWPAGL